MAQKLTPAEWRAKAEQCRAVANASEDPERATEALKLAEQFDRRAMEADAKLKSARKRMS